MRQATNVCLSLWTHNIYFWQFLQLRDILKSNLQFPRQTALINKAVSCWIQSSDRAISNKFLNSWSVTIYHRENVQVYVYTGKPKETWFNPIFAPVIRSNIKKDQIASLSTELCWQGTSGCERAHSGLCYNQKKTELRQAEDWKMTQWVWLWQRLQNVGDYFDSINDAVFGLQPFHSNNLNYQIALAVRSNPAPVV